MSSESSYIGNYRLVAELASGAFGRVFLAHHVVLTRGLASLFLDRYETALDAFEQALQLSPNSAMGWYYKSCALEYLGRPEEAHQAYDRARHFGL